MDKPWIVKELDKKIVIACFFSELMAFKPGGKLLDQQIFKTCTLSINIAEQFSSKTNKYG